MFHTPIIRLVTVNTYGILDRWSVAEGGNIFWKFFEPGFLKRCKGELPKSLVSPWSSSPSRGSCTDWCLERVTRIIFPYIFCPLRWLMAEKDKFTQLSAAFQQLVVHHTCKEEKHSSKSKGQCAKGLESRTRSADTLCQYLILFRDHHIWFSCWIHLGYSFKCRPSGTQVHAKRFWIWWITKIRNRLTNINKFSSPDLTQPNFQVLRLMGI